METISHSVPMQSEESSVTTSINIGLRKKSHIPRNKNSTSNMPNNNISSIKSMELPKPVSIKRGSVQPNRAAT